MVQQELIVKEAARHDARVTVVHLTDKGRARVEKMQAHLYASIGKVIDKIGMERMEAFITISQEICNAMEKPDFSE